jgi:hypothetical protein
VFVEQKALAVLLTQPPLRFGRAFVAGGSNRSG